MGAFFTELKRRNVFKVGVAYAIVAWLLVQIMVAVETPLHLPPWADTLTITLLFIGFPIALLLAWAFELTPEGVKRIGKADRQRVVVENSADPVTTAPAVPPAEHSIAVLPFVNMSSDPEQEYFSDGISEELINQLTKIRDLHVAGRTSSFFFKGKDEDLRVIGEKLNVAHVLEGSVRKSGNRVRITAQLIKVGDGYHLWSENYDRNLDDIFAIQEETARAVTDALSITLGVGEGKLAVGGTRNFVAYDAYLAGLALFKRLGRENVLCAIDKLETAVELDPKFALAWGLLSDVYYSAANAYVPDRQREFTKKSEEAATRAMELTPDAVESLIVRTQHCEWIKAEALFARIFELTPMPDYRTNLNYGIFLMAVGRAREAIRYVQQAVQLEPLASVSHVVLGLAREYSGDSDAALQAFSRAAELTDQPALVNSALMVLAMEKNDRALIEKYIALVVDTELIPGLTRAGSRDINRVMHAMLDTPEAARAELHRFLEDSAYTESFTRTAIAVWAAYFGDPVLSLRIYSEVFAARGSLNHIIWRPILGEMRRLPGFKDLVRNLGLVDYWRATGNWGEFCRPIGDDDFECL